MIKRDRRNPKTRRSSSYVIMLAVFPLLYRLPRSWSKYLLDWGRRSMDGLCRFHVTSCPTVHTHHPRLRGCDCSADRRISYGPRSSPDPADSDAGRGGNFLVQILQLQRAPNTPPRRSREYVNNYKRHKIQQNVTMLLQPNKYFRRPRHQCNFVRCGPITRRCEMRAQLVYSTLRGSIDQYSSA